MDTSDFFGLNLAARQQSEAPGKGTPDVSGVDKLANDSLDVGTTRTSGSLVPASQRFRENVRKFAGPFAEKLATVIIRTSRQGSIAIFAAHGIHTPTMCNGVNPPPSSKGVEEFEKVLLAIKRHFTIVSMDEAVEMLSGRIPVRAACAVLTFDDSLKCMADVVAPLLVGMNLTATFFISTEAIETQEPYWWLRLDYALLHAQTRRFEIKLPTGDQLWLDTSSTASGRSLKQALRRLSNPEREQIILEVESVTDVSLSDGNKEYPFAAPLTWDGVRELLNLGMFVGSHSVSHANLLAISEPELSRELVDSKRVIEQKSGAMCRHFCYPYGLHSGTISKAVSDRAYDSAVTTDSPGWNRSGDDMFSLRRFSFPANPAKLPYLLCR